LENKPGALARVVGIIASTGSNIESLSVSPDPRRPGLSQLQMEAEVDSVQLRWLLGKINGLVNVLDAEECPTLELPPVRRAAPGLDLGLGWLDGLMRRAVAVATRRTQCSQAKSLPD
jgi:hypothetical protein